MKPLWLVQKGTKRFNSAKKGIDALVQFDYMGSFEFEYGALPAALKRVRAVAVDYITFDLKIYEKPITVFCSKRESQARIKTILDDLACGLIHLKERCEFREYIGFKKSLFSTDTRIDFWWDIDNDWFFWASDADFTEKFVKAVKEEK